MIHREKNRTREKEAKGDKGERKIREIIAYLKQKYIPLNVVSATFSLQLLPSEKHFLK